LTDLAGRFDTKPYLTPHSDIVALMVLAHQTHIHNLITVANYKLQAALQADAKADTTALVKELAEPVCGRCCFQARRR